MDDFASYTPKEKTDAAWLEEAQKVAASCKGKGEERLLREIYARAAEGKKNGTLTNAQIDRFCAQLLPMLDGAKRKKLQKIAEALKKM